MPAYGKFVMTKLTLKPVATYTHAFEAEATRNRLAIAGIRAIVTGTDVAHSFSMGGAPQDRLVRNEVAEENYNRAREILAEDRRRAAQADSWKCGQCGEENDATFDLCWKCHSNISEGEPVKAKTIVAPITVDQSTIGKPITDENPYQPILIRAPVVQEQPTRNRPALQPQLASEVNRALRCTVIGLWIFPPLISLYAMYLLCRLPAYWPRHPAARWKVLAAGLVNVVSITAWTAVWMSQSGMIF